MSEGNGWVIEHGASEVSRPRYWGGVYGWTYDNLQAVRFAREADARSQAEAMDDGVPDNYRICEHLWADPPAHEWFTPDFLAYECCRYCGIVRRLDGKNRPCRGRVGISLRGHGRQSGAASPEIGSVPNTAAETDGTNDDRKTK